VKRIEVQKPGPPGVMQLLFESIPEPGPGEVVVKAHAIGVGIPDCMIRAGTYGYMPPLPVTPGTEMSGTIEAVGEGVTSRKIGQRVYTTARERPHRGGHYADYIAAPAEATFILPYNVDFDAAAALANYQVAYHIFNDALQPRKGQTVLIYAAAGGMGNALIDLAKVAGLTVIGVVSSENKAHFARELGADHTINRKSDKVAERVRELTQGRGVDAIIDPVAGKTLADNIAMLAPCGTLLVYGALGGKLELDLPSTPLWRRNTIAVRLFTIHTWDHLVEERRAGMRALIDMLAAGKLHPRIYAKLPLKQAARAHEMLEGGEVLGKLLLIP
jgi:NADPH2:quinone reductase